MTRDTYNQAHQLVIDIEFTTGIYTGLTMAFADAASGSPLGQEGWNSLQLALASGVIPYNSLCQTIEAGQRAYYDLMKAKEAELAAIVTD